jgi:hypothetical protein
MVASREAPVEGGGEMAVSSLGRIGVAAAAGMEEAGRGNRSVGGVGLAVSVKAKRGG